MATKLSKSNNLDYHIGTIVSGEDFISDIIRKKEFREEYEDRGSERYINDNQDKVFAMINLDTCGYVDTILIWTKENLKKEEFKQVIAPILLHKHCAEIIDRNPGSDDRSFKFKDILDISIYIRRKSDHRDVRRLKLLL